MYIHIIYIFAYPSLLSLCMFLVPFVRYVTPTRWASGSSAMLSGSSCGTSAGDLSAANVNWFPDF